MVTFKYHSAFFFLLLKILTFSYDHIHKNKWHSLILRTTDHKQKPLASDRVCLLDLLLLAY